MKKALLCLIPTMVLFTLMDYLWLGWVAQDLYKHYLVSMMRLEDGELTAQLLPAIMVYVLFALMIWSIVLPLADNQVAKALAKGALVGFVFYGIYDMTNMAVLKTWPLPIALIDWCWGVVICATTSGACQWLKNRFG